jgi:beta-phosphoglucomutase-like phosphatase (HAD superfamily)
MAPSAVVFDFDGLILDTETPEYVSVSKVFAEHGVDLPLDEWVQIVGSTDHPHWLDWLAGLTELQDEREAIRLRRLAHHHDLIAVEELRPGVLDRLEEADALGIPVAVASSSSVEWVQGHLERLGLVDRFVCLRGRDHVEPGRTKPHPDLFIAAVEALGVDAHPAEAPAGAAAPTVRGSARPRPTDHRRRNVVAFEDSPNGVRAAKAAGLYAVAVPNGITAGGDFSAADLVVPSLRHVSLVDLPLA